MSAQIKRIKINDLRLKIFILFSFLFILHSSLIINPVYADHCDSFDLTTPVGQAQCAAEAGGQYCDNNQVWQDLPNIVNGSTHRFIKTCPSDTTCKQDTSRGEITDAIAYCESNSVASPTTSSASATLDPTTLNTPEKAGLLYLDQATNALPCFLWGEPLAAGQHCLTRDKAGNLKYLDQIPGVASGGALGGLGTIMMAMYNNPPVSTTQYLASVKENLGLAKPALAADDCDRIPGSGCRVILPMLKLWQLSRNISYLAFILIFVIVGFMIMFRTRISQQTVVSAQQALPGLVIGLILVTFSYLLSAFIVDFSFVGMKLVAYLFSPSISGVPNIISDPNKVADQSNIFGLFGAFTWNGQLLEFIPSVAKLFLSVFSGFGFTLNGFQPSDLFNPGFLIGKYIINQTSLALGGVFGILVILVLLIALFIQMFRLIWQLVSCYIAVLVITIAGPLIILISSIPGRGAVMSLWWKSLLGNILVFPAVFASFMFAGVFLAGVSSSSAVGTFGSGDFTTALPLFAGIPVETLKLIIGYGIVLGTPSVPGMVKKALGVPDIQGIPQEVMAGAMVSYGAASPLGQASGRGLINVAARRGEAAGAAGWQRNISDRLARRYGSNPQKYPWYTGPKPPT